MHRDAPRKVAEAADVVVVEMAHGDRHDVPRVHADVRKGVLQRIARSRQLELRRAAAPESVIQGAVANERAVETRVEQHVAVLGLEEEARNRLAQEDPALGFGNQGHGDPAGNVLPAERQREHPPYTALHRTSMASGSARVKAAASKPIAPSRLDGSRKTLVP